MVDGGKVILFVIGLVIATAIGIEVVYGMNSCCPCCKKVATSDGVIEKCNTISNECCKCSFLKEKFGIDIYFWKK